MCIRDRLLGDRTEGFGSYERCTCSNIFVRWFVPVVERTFGLLGLGFIESQHLPEKRQVSSGDARGWAHVPQNTVGDRSYVRQHGYVFVLPIKQRKQTRVQFVRNKTLLFRQRWSFGQVEKFPLQKISIWYPEKIRSQYQNQNQGTTGLRVLRLRKIGTILDFARTDCYMCLRLSMSRTFDAFLRILQL